MASKMFTLISSDKEHFEVTEAMAKMSQTIWQTIEDSCTDGGIPLFNVSAKVLSKVLEYCNKHAAAAIGPDPVPSPKVMAIVCSDDARSSLNPSFSKDNDLAKFNKEFINDIDQDMLHDLLSAANYLNIKSLLDLCCNKITDMIKKKTPEQIREMLGIKNDFSAEEEEEIRRENQWAFK